MLVKPFMITRLKRMGKGMGNEKNNGKREWEIRGNSFFKGKGKEKVTIF